MKVLYGFRIWGGLSCWRRGFCFPAWPSALHSPRLNSMMTTTPSGWDTPRTGRAWTQGRCQKWVHDNSWENFSIMIFMKKERRSCLRQHQTWHVISSDLRAYLDDGYIARYSNCFHSVVRRFQDWHLHPLWRVQRSLVRLRVVLVLLEVPGQDEAGCPGLHGPELSQGIHVPGFCEGSHVSRVKHTEWWFFNDMTDVWTKTLRNALLYIVAS